jgi:hypothetical protein
LKKRMLALPLASPPPLPQPATARANSARTAPWATRRTAARIPMLETWRFIAFSAIDPTLE